MPRSEVLQAFAGIALGLNGQIPVTANPHLMLEGVMAWPHALQNSPAKLALLTTWDTFSDIYSEHSLLNPFAILL